jgi:electron transfer flavoprotein beta subunit
MLNMRGVMPALQKAKAVAINAGGIAYEKAEIPAQKRDTRIVKDMPADDIAKEIVEWLKA